MLSVDLGSNGILRRFEFDVDFVELDILPPFLHKALVSISSPHFSEFSLRLFPGLHDFDSDEGTGGWRTQDSRREVETLGAGWEAVDEDLYVLAAGRDDFRFTIEFVTGQLTVATVEECFPRMKSRGSLVITQQQPRW